MEKYYKILEIHPNATEQEVKQAYRDMVKVWHPDRFAHDIRLRKKAEENLKKINDAYERIVYHLNNSHKRQQSQQYERTEKQKKTASQPPPQQPHNSWICPDCLRTNYINNLSCGCGFRTNKVEVTTYKADQSSADLYDVILFNRGMNNKDRANFLARYLLKRFPNSKEADFIKKNSYRKQKPPRQTKPNKLRHLKKNWGWYLVLGLILLAITVEMAWNARKHRVINPFDTKPVANVEKATGTVEEERLSQAREWFEMGEQHYSNNEFDKAIEAYTNAIALDPNDGVAYFQIGYCNGSLGRYTEAIEAFKQAIRIKPDYAKAHCGLGFTYGRLGRYSEAIEACKQAIRIKPDYAAAHYHLGVNYGNLGRYTEAMEAYKQAIRIKPDYADAHYNLGEAYEKLGDKGSALAEYHILKDLDKDLANKLFGFISKE